MLWATVGGCSDKPAAQLGAWGIETQYIDHDHDPGNDFYRFANGGWLDSTVIPPDLTVIDSFVEVHRRTDDQLDALMASADVDAAPGSPEQQIAALRASYLDTERRNALGISMLEDDLARILLADGSAVLAELMGRAGFPSVFTMEVDIDPGHPEHYVATIAQGKLGLPDRAFYLAQEEPYTSLRAGYETYIADTFTRAGIDDAKARAAAVMAYETAIAGAQWTPAELRDAEHSYHLMRLDEIVRYAPGFAWRAYLAAAGLSTVDEVNLRTDTAIQAMAALVGRAPLQTQCSYMAFHYLNDHAHLLSDGWVDAHFAFFDTELNGTQDEQPLEERATRLVSDHLGEPVGQLYVARYFPAKAKAEIERMISHLRAAFEAHIGALDWMDDATRAEALAKLEAFGVKVAYPSRWRDQRSLEIAPDDLVGNIRRIAEWERQDAIAKLGAPVRAWEWSMTPQTVDAYYDLTRNEIVFPAAILQPPFFDPAADPAVNFGAIGAVIGHEMSHGFDERGSRYDRTGRLRDWWSTASRRNFEAQAQRLVDQYSSYSPLEGVSVDGRLTLNENIADLGGLSLAHAAYVRFGQAAHDGEPPTLDGYTGAQRLFLSYAQMWRMRMTDEALRRHLLDDPHSPGQYRTNGVVANTDAWYADWNVDAEDASYRAPADRVRIW